MRGVLMDSAESMHNSPLRSETASGVWFIYVGRHVLGAAATLFGVLTLCWRDFNHWQQIRPLGQFRHREALACAAGIVELLGGSSLTSRAEGCRAFILHGELPKGVCWDLRAHGSRRAMVAAD